MSAGLGRRAPQRRVCGRGEEAVGCGGEAGSWSACCLQVLCESRAEETKERGRPESTGVGKRLARGEPPTAHRPKLGAVKMGPQLPCRDATSLPVPLLALPGSPGLPADPLALGNNSGARAGHCESVRRPRPALSSHREGAVGSQSPWRWYRLYPAQSI